MDESATASATYNPPPPPVRYTAANEAAIITAPGLELERTRLAASADLLEILEERAAIMEADGGLSRDEADRLARLAVLGPLAEAVARVEEWFGAASVEEASAASDHWEGPQRN